MPSFEHLAATCHGTREVIEFNTWPIPWIENPPIKSAEAEPDALLGSLDIALTEKEISDLMPLDLYTECTKCSGE